MPFSTLFPQISKNDFILNPGGSMCYKRHLKEEYILKTLNTLNKIIFLTVEIILFYNNQSLTNT